MKVGSIVKNIAGRVCVYSDGKTYECVLRGKVKQNNKKILVGDKCIFSDENLSVEEILPRKNELIRPPVSNIDQIVALISIVPEPDFALIDKIIIESELVNARCILVISKNDIIDNNELITKIKEEFKDSTYEIIVTSAENNYGIDEIRKVLENKISVFVGQSGVGKSSLLNAICKKTIQEVGLVSAKDMRGKNTTRASEIFYHENFVIIDSPGFNMLNILDIKSSELKNYFKEIQKYADLCEYRTCDHINAEEEICGVKQMLKCGKIPKERYLRYKSLYELIKKEEQYKYAKKGKSFS